MHAALIVLRLTKRKIMFLDKQSHHVAHTARDAASDEQSPQQPAHFYWHCARRCFNQIKLLALET